MGEESGHAGAFPEAAAGRHQRLDEGFPFYAMTSDPRYLLTGLRGDLSWISG